MSELSRPERCARLLVGRGDDTYDPECALPRGHPGSCSPEDAAPMSQRGQGDSGFTDPRDLGGDVSGPGGPYDRGAFVVDARRALLVDYQEVCQIDGWGEDVYALLLEGRVNRTQDRAKVMAVGGIDFMAALITELHGVAERAGVGDELRRACDERWQEMPH